MAFPKQCDLLAKYGNPSHPGWKTNNIIRVTPPFSVFAGRLPVHSIEIHKDVADSLNKVLFEIWDASGHSQSKIHSWGMDRFDGSFVVRAIRGGKNWSNHAFGYACDFDARRNPLGKKGNFTKDHPVVKAFQRNGWRWGGTYKKRLDPMHFEAVSG